MNKLTYKKVKNKKKVKILKREINNNSCLLQFLQGNFLDDVNRLHLPSLTWRRPPTLHGRPARALRNIAGHSLEGLIAFGGCIPTIVGIMPVAKTDPLLIGEHCQVCRSLVKTLFHTWDNVAIVKTVELLYELGNPVCNWHQENEEEGQENLEVERGSILRQLAEMFAAGASTGMHAVLRFARVKQLRCPAVLYRSPDSS